MLHVVTKQNAHLYKDQIEQSFRIRHDIYVGERKWMALERPDRREVDQFDTLSAIYLLSLESDGRVVGGSRLVPSLEPHLLSDVFPALASFRPVPRSARVAEWTRFYVVPARREQHAVSYVAAEIMCGVQEFGMVQGLDQFSIVSETFFFPRFLELGWAPEPLGLPQQIDGAPVMAYTVKVSEEALARTRALHGIKTSVLVTQGLDWPREHDRASRHSPAEKKWRSGSRR